MSIQDIIFFIVLYIILGGAATIVIREATRPAKMPKGTRWLFVALWPGMLLITAFICGVLPSPDCEDE